jgi:hypothetical protein
MQASKVNGYITNEGRLVLDVLLTLPPGRVEVVVLSEETGALQEPATEEAEQSGSPDVQVSYTPEQEATIKAFLAAAGCGSSGNPDSSVSVDEVLYGGKK